MGNVCGIFESGYSPAELIMKIGIIGYGNLGRAVETVAQDHGDIEVFGVFTRREQESINTRYARAYPVSELMRYRKEIDTLILCYGSSSDLPYAAVDMIRHFNLVDTYDNHKRIEDHKSSLDTVARACGRTAIISFGWDPGLLSVIRLILSAMIPHSSVNTFWGRGISQGHGEAIRRIPGVIRAIQYTVPRADALTLASLVSHPLDDTDRHKRVCYVAAEKEKEDAVRDSILSMENYFLGYDTEVHFVAPDDPVFESATPSHRGRVYAIGKSGVYGETRHTAYFDLDLGSNPELTAHIALLGARIGYSLFLKKRYGAYSIFDLPLSEICKSCGKNVNDYL